MIMINADDWGRSRKETDVALECFRSGRITSVSAMVFMADSMRAADLAKEYDLDVGLHLNLTEEFSADVPDHELEISHGRIMRYLTRNKYAGVVYHPLLRRDFRYVFQAQVREFERLYGRPPSRVDGHHHMHLCANMLLSNIIPTGVKVRRNFSFWRGDKGFLNRSYRALVDRWLVRRHPISDYFFCLGQSLQTNRLHRVVQLAKASSVELMTHPLNPIEYRFLMDAGTFKLLAGLDTGTYAPIQ